MLNIPSGGWLGPGVLAGGGLCRVCRLCVVCHFLEWFVQGLWGYAPFLSTLFQKSQAYFLMSRFLNARN